MSRSALWRQEAGVKERELHAEEAFRTAIEEGRNNRTKGLIPLYGPDDSFHVNPMLLQCIAKSPYFVKCCENIKDWNALVDEIYYEVKHAEPWAAGQQSKTPSSAFSLLLRLLTLRCSEKQMNLLLDHKDSPYIRCIGFLYLRYACEPGQLWNWIKPYVFDEEQVQVRFNPASPEIHMGEYVRSLFGELDYFGTRLPRLPIQTERDLKVKILQAEKVEDRAKRHLSNVRTMDYFQKLGSRVRAQYEDEQNPLTWYDAVVDRVLTTDPGSGAPLRRPKFIVTFPEYGNTETVTLGDMDMPGGGGEENDRANRGGTDRGRDYRRDNRPRGGFNDDRGRGYQDDDRGRGYNHDDRRGYDDRRRGDNDRDNRRTGYNDRGYNNDRQVRSRSRERDEDLMEEVRRREREGSTAKGKAYAARPPSTKSSLSYNDRKRAPEDDFPKRRRPPPKKEEAPPAFAHKPREKTPAELAAIAEKKRKLSSRYG